MRLIDADALIEVLEKTHTRFCEMCGCDNQNINSLHDYAVNVIGDAPTAEPSGDLISREDALTALNGACATWEDDAKVADIINGLPSAEEALLNAYYDGFNTASIEALQSAEAVQGWIPFTRRPMTEEEQKDYPNCTFMFDCVLPDDGDEILVSNGRFVWMDVFCNDVDGCYLDSGDDIDEDMAWMPLPTPYKGGGDK